MKKTFTLSAIALVMMTACSQTPSTQNNAATTVLAPLTSLAVSPNDQRDYRTVKLSNNIEVILVSDPATKKSAAALNVGVGFLQDPMEQQGLAHYLEHLLFLGTEKYPETSEYSEFLKENGGTLNASTWLTYTNYMFKVNNNAFDETLDRFSDFFKSPKFYPEYTDKERNAVNSEWSMRGELDFFAQFKLSRSMMGEHAANRFLIGNLETLSDKENSNLHKETVDFYNKYYSSNIMKVSMVSNLPLDEMEALATKHFSSIIDKNIEKPEIKQTLDFTKVGSKKVYFKPNQDIKQLKLDFTIANNMSQFTVKPNHFISYLLGSDMPGTPAQILKAKGWISSLDAGASANHYGNYGEFSITLDLTDDGMANRDEIVAMIMQYIDLIKAKGVDEKYYKEIKTALDNEFRFLEKGDEFNYVANLVDSMQDYSTNYAINAPYYYGQFDAQAIENVLSQLTPETLRIWYVSKNEKVTEKQHFYQGEYRIEDIGADEIASWKNNVTTVLSLPLVNRLLPENFDIKPQNSNQQKPELKVEHNGVKVWHYPSQLFAEQPKGIIKVDINSGEAIANINTQVALAIWQDVYNLKQSLLMSEAQAAGISTKASAGKGMTLFVDGFTDKQSTLLNSLLTDLTPNVDEQSFLQAKDRYMRDIANIQKQFAVRQIGGAFTKVIRKDQFENSALIEAANVMTLTDFNKVIAQVTKNNQPRIFAFGNYSQKDLKQVAVLVSKALGTDKKTTSYAKNVYLKPKSGQVLSYQQDIAAADIALLDVYFHAKAGYRSLATAKVLANHFTFEASNQLRTEEQLGYAVGATDMAMDNYAGIGLYIQSPVLDLVQAQARFDKFNVEYKVLLDALTQESFDKIKDGVLVSLTQAPKNLYQEISPMFSDWEKENWNYDSKAKLIEQVKSVSLTDIKNFYKATLANPNAARVNVQLRGTKYQDKPFATLANQIVIQDAATVAKKVDYQK
ncbi:insulinase family protein [Colwellia sp. 20A7]|uniref:insulinase family protein n=1 Tax=Colwellia sp. 20A7 TaxID=2689569 RepID=UPI0013581A4A|nr:insulinase family protein [Colwellia sp. 20A7]